MPDQRVLVASLVVISILYLFLIYEVEAFCSPCLDCEAYFTITSIVYSERTALMFTFRSFRVRQMQRLAHWSGPICGNNPGSRRC